MREIGVSGGASTMGWIDVYLLSRRRHAGDQEGHLSTVLRALELFFRAIISIKRREAFFRGRIGESLLAPCSFLAFQPMRRCSGLESMLVRQWSWNQLHQTRIYIINIIPFHSYCHFSMKYIMISSPTDCV